MDNLSAFFLGAVLNLLFNVTAGLINRRVAIRITRWGWLYFFLHATYLLFSWGPIERMSINLRFQFGDSGLLSYIVVTFIGASIAVVYWVGINIAYSRMFHPEEPIVSGPATTHAPTTPPQTTTTPTPQRTPQPQQAETTPSSNVQPTNKSRPKSRRRRTPPPDDGEDILLGRKKGPEVH